MAYRNYQDLKERKPTRFWHESLVDDMLAFPTASGAERAARLGRSPTYLSIVMNTDMFKALFEERRRLFNERFAGAIAHKTAMLADKALDVVLETLDKKRTQLPFDSLVELTDRTLARLGYGDSGKGTHVSVNVGIGAAPMVNAQQLAEARAALRAVENQRVIEHEAGPMGPALPSLKAPMGAALTSHVDPPRVEDSPEAKGNSSSPSVEELA